MAKLQPEGPGEGRAVPGSAQGILPPSVGNLEFTEVEITAQ